MNVALKKMDQVYRGDYTFANSPAAIRRFPLPFPEDRYMYSVNIEPHVAGPKGSVIEFPIDCDEHYVEECRERAHRRSSRIRCGIQALPHMMAAQWDCWSSACSRCSQSYPQRFTLTRAGRQWHWTNRPLGLNQKFTFGDPTSLPQPPLEYITRQLQGDWVIMDQRDNDLWVEGGMVTGPADWSMDFDIGMSFKEWHGPVPLGHEMGVFDRALKFLFNLRLNEPVRRYNWTMTVNPNLDTSPDNYPGMGTGPYDRDARERREEAAPAHRAAGVVAAAALQRHRLHGAHLHAEPWGRCEYSEMGAPRASRAARSASGAGRLQGTDASPPGRGRLPFTVR